MNNNNILDNRPSYGKVGDFLSSHLDAGSKLDVVSAYFTIYAFQQLEKKLNQIDSMRFLFGEPRFIKPEHLDPEMNNPNNFILKHDQLSPEKELIQRNLAKLCAKWIESKVEIKTVKNKQFIHGKSYFIEQTNQSKHVVMGSSNFTQSGLGYGQNHNIELNLIIQDQDTKDQLKQWFEEIWNNNELTENIKDKVLAYLEKVHTDQNPQFVYYKTLFEIFYFKMQGELSKSDFDYKHRLENTQIWKKLYQFQQDAVGFVLRKLRDFNGCILADSVGLGKTYTALTVIKFYELQNYRVLVLCPKKLEQNWIIYTNTANHQHNPFGKEYFNYTVLAHTDLDRTSGKKNAIDFKYFNWGAYDLVVIDESHNFRNNGNRYKTLLSNVIQEGNQTRVLLLSATPVNNNLNDLHNQLRLITHNNDSAFHDNLKILSLNKLITNAQKAFNSWVKTTLNHHNKAELIQKLDSGFFKLLDELTIARSRSQICRYYKKDLKAIGEFPHREKPINVEFDLAFDLEIIPTYEKIAEQIDKYSLAIFSPSYFLKKEYQDIDLYTFKNEKKLSSKQQKQSENHLIGMMKTNFLKRLESSVCAFVLTLQRTLAKIQARIELIHNYKNKNKDNKNYIISDDLNNLSQDEIESLEIEEEYLLDVGKIQIEMDHLDLNAWLEKLTEDQTHLKVLLDKMLEISAEKDGKLKALCDLIQRKLENPTNQNNRKILIFTAFADTATYLYNELTKRFQNQLNFGLVKGSGDNQTTYGSNDFLSILENFSPISKQRDSKNHHAEIDILIATDCISEGQNLQDCDYLINYDIHWNPVRIIQRFGRIDRLGSKNKNIYLVNFWAMHDLDQYLKLKSRVESRMALSNLTATTEDNPLESVKISDDENKILIQNAGSYRDEQLKRIQHEIMDIEEFNESVSLNDFSFEEFRLQLLSFLEAHKKSLLDAPLGLYAIIKSKSEQDKGVIFCLEETTNQNFKQESKEINPLGNYFLVYVRDDGKIRYQYKNAQHTLQFLRQYCQDDKKPNHSLYDAFDIETNYGQEMSFYNHLIQACLTHIKSNSTSQLVLGALHSKMQLTATDSKKDKATMFKLVSWFIIQ